MTQQVLSTTQPLQILHLIPMVGYASGGLGPVALELSSAQRTLGNRATIWSTDSEQAFADLTHDRALPADLVRRFPAIGPARLAYSPAAERVACSEEGAQFHLLHLHSLWTACSALSLHWRQRYHRPTIITPHGSLTPRALRRSVLRKRLSWWAYEARNFRAASCFHALSMTELTDIRDFGIRAPIAVIPNGISEEWLASTGVGARFREAFAIAADQRLLLFLSRITPIKGLPLFLRAMAACRQALRDWLLVLAGPDEFGHQRELQTLLEQLDIAHRVRFVGPLYGQMKRDAFAAAEVFVLPSHSEGAPMSVLEALGAGVPVLTTEAVSLPELHRDQCGWQVAATEPALRGGLTAVIAESPAALQAMGQRGKALVAGSYTWRIAAVRSLQCYRWLLDEEEQPECVFMD
ncbi:MAG: glycosyltransferase [Armatimonadota bacterium]